MRPADSFRSAVLRVGLLVHLDRDGRASLHGAFCRSARGAGIACDVAREDVRNWRVTRGQPGTLGPVQGGQPEKLCEFSRR